MRYSKRCPSSCDSPTVLTHFRWHIADMSRVNKASIFNAVRNCAFALSCYFMFRRFVLQYFADIGKVTFRSTYLKLLTEAGHSPPCSADVKIAWSYTSRPLYVFMAW